MSIERRLQREIKDSKIRYSRENDDSRYKRYLMKRIDLINRVLENMKDPDTKICDLVESKMKETIIKIHRTYSITEADKLHSELRILDWIFYQVYSIKKKLLNLIVPRSCSL
jgi:hypothetical protein